MNVKLQTLLKKYLENQTQEVKLNSEMEIDATKFALIEFSLAGLTDIDIDTSAATIITIESDQNLVFKYDNADIIKLGNGKIFTHENIDGVDNINIENISTDTSANITMSYMTRT